jgi:DNA polymerase (family 10)
MPIHNRDVADIFNRLADLLEIEAANAFRIRAYRIAAQTVRDLPRSVCDMVEDREDFSKLPGIGKDLAGKIEEIVATGGLTALKEHEATTPPELAEMMKLPGLGPKRVRALHEELAINSLSDLRRSAQQHLIRQLPGFGAKTETKILQELDRHAQLASRYRRTDMEEIAFDYVDYLHAVPGAKQVTVAGSYRRCKETIGDLDILVCCGKGSPVMDRFVAYDEVEEVILHGKTKSTVRLRSGLQVDVRVVPAESYGAALHYFTGSKSHNIAIRKMGMRRILKINEYGVFMGKERIAGRTESEVYKQVGLPYIEPELRENRGEIEAARTGQLPRLITANDIRGNLHTHTDASDGKVSLKEMAAAAKKLGYQYLAITDHSKHLSVANGLDAKRLRRQIRKIDRLNEQLKGIRLLKGIEVDILQDGSLDLGDDVLSELDLVVCAVHSQFNLSREDQTERILRAMDNPHFNILAHPTGRLIGRRAGYDIDMDRLMDCAVERGCFMEINAQPARLDLDDVHCRMAKNKGLRLAISTDAHSKTDLEFMRWGVDQARRGWIEPADVLNTRSLRDLRRLLKRS